MLTSATPVPFATVVATLLAPGLTLVTFRKRTDGTLRTMLCVPAWQGKGDAAYAPGTRGLIRVFDVEKDGYRMVPIDAVVSVRKPPAFATASAALSAYAA